MLRDWLAHCKSADVFTERTLSLLCLDEAPCSEHYLIGSHTVCRFSVYPSYEPLELCPTYLSMMDLASVRTVQDPQETHV